MSEDEGQILGGCVVSLDGVVIGYDPNNPLVRVPDLTINSVSYTHLTLPTTPYV